MSPRVEWVGWIGGGGGNGSVGVFSTLRVYGFFFFFKQKTAYEIGTGDWSSDVCSSDLSHPWMGNVLKEAKYKATCCHYVTLGYLQAFWKREDRKSVV